jgi:hypothetical protein
VIALPAKIDTIASMLPGVSSGQKILPTSPHTQQALSGLRCGFVKWRPSAAGGETGAVISLSA